MQIAMMIKVMMLPMTSLMQPQPEDEFQFQIWVGLAAFLASASCFFRSTGSCTRGVKDLIAEAALLGHLGNLLATVGARFQLLLVLFSLGSCREEGIEL